MSGARNNLDAVADMLMEQLEAVSNEDLSGEELNNALKRASGSNSIAKTIIDIRKVQLDAIKVNLQFGIDNMESEKLELLTGGAKK